MKLTDHLRKISTSTIVFIGLSFLNSPFLGASQAQNSEESAQNKGANGNFELISTSEAPVAVLSANDFELTSEIGNIAGEALSGGNFSLSPVYAPVVDLNPPGEDLWIIQ